MRSQHVTADTFVWAAGEASTLVPVRRYLKQELGLPKQHLSLHGYWKLGVGQRSGTRPFLEFAVSQKKRKVRRSISS